MRIFDKSLTLWNYGQIEAPLTIEQLSMPHNSYPRNPLIAKTFFRAGLIEAWGRGTLTIINETVESGLAMPIFAHVAGGVQISFPRTETIEISNTTFSPNERQTKVLAYLKEHGHIQRKQYEELTGCSKRTSIRDLNELLTQNIIIPEGANKSVIYKLK